MYNQASLGLRIYGILSSALAIFSLTARRPLEVPAFQRSHAKPAWCKEQWLDSTICPAHDTTKNHQDFEAMQAKHHRRDGLFSTEKATTQHNYTPQKGRATGQQSAVRARPAQASTRAAVHCPRAGWRKPALRPSSGGSWCQGRKENCEFGIWSLQMWSAFSGGENPFVARTKGTPSLPSEVGVALGGSCCVLLVVLGGAWRTRALAMGGLVCQTVARSSALPGCACSAGAGQGLTPVSSQAKSLR